jgi:UDP-glucose 4-epimerase
MQIIVTGAAGYIGSHVCQELLSQGFEVLAVDDLSTGRIEFLDSRVGFFQGKVQDEGFLREVFGNIDRPKISGVIHCAGSKFAGESVKHPLNYYENNTLAVQVLLKVMLEHKVHSLIFSSSCSVYGSLNKVEPVTEKVDPNPISPYGRSKYFAELVIADVVSASDLRAVSLRYFNVAGNAPGVGYDSSEFNLLPNLYRSFSTKKEFRIFGTNHETPDGSCVRDYVDVKLLADAHRTAMQKLILGEKLEPVYNLGSGVGASVLEIVNAAKNEIDENLEVIIFDARPGDPAIILSDTTLAQRDLDWSHPVTINEMVVSGWESWQAK